MTTSSLHSDTPFIKQIVQSSGLKHPRFFIGAAVDVYADDMSSGNRYITRFEGVIVQLSHSYRWDESTKNESVILEMRTEPRGDGDRLLRVEFLRFKPPNERRAKIKTCAHIAYPKENSMASTTIVLRDSKKVLAEDGALTKVGPQY